LNGLNGIIPYRQKNNSLLVQFLPTYIPMTVREHLIQTQKNNFISPTRAAEKIDCPFSMPTSRKERPAMTKPREKTREELTAEIEESKIR